MRTLLLLSVLISFSHAFVAPISSVVSRTRIQVSTNTDVVDIAVYRSRFFLWFFGSQGAATVGLGALPGMKKNVDLINSLKDLGPTKGGEGVGISPLCGYPRDLSRADIEQIVKNPLRVDQIVAKYPYPEIFLSTKGYLSYQAFRDANSMANPLAVRAVFDSLGQGTNVVDPIVAQTKLDSYKSDLLQFNSDLLRSKLIGWSSISVLVFLLGYAFLEALSSAYKGWFPEWDPSTGPWTIPDYWI